MQSTLLTFVLCLPSSLAMNTDNIQVQLRKGVLELCILNIISRGEVYTSDMIQELTQARMMVVEGTLYPLLTRLKNSGYLDYKWVESSSGPPRKYYMLTDTGAAFLGELTQTWQDMTRSVQQIMEKTLHNQPSSEPTSPESL
jgi:PadR family transcriptional regulator, regulatory protein PadR